MENKAVEATANAAPHLDRSMKVYLVLLVDHLLSSYTQRTANLSNHTPIFAVMSDATDGSRICTAQIEPDD